MELNGRFSAIVGKYSCDACGIRRKSLAMPIRDEGESIKAYIESVMLAVSTDHSKVSPTCKAETLSELMLPIDEKGQRPIGT